MTETAAVIRVEIKEHIAHVILDNPKKLNAMGATFQDDLVASFDEIEDNDEVRAVVLFGEGRAFCAGLDLMAFASLEPSLMAIPAPAASKPRVLRMIRRFQEAITSVEKCRKPVIAAIHGWCIGGGLDLAAACDIRLAAQDATFSLREAKVAIMADLGSLQRLPYIIGEGHTRQLAFTAEDIDVDRAFRIGLVNDVYETREQLLEAAEEMAKKIVANAPLAVQASKEVMNWNRGRPIQDTLEYVAARNTPILPSEDLMEAIAAFAARKAPNYQGK